MDIDLHIHTNRYSGCSNIDPAKLLKKARAVGLDGIALTEHGIDFKDLHSSESSLEDIFVSLVHQDKAPAPSAQKAIPA